MKIERVYRPYLTALEAAQKRSAAGRLPLFREGEKKGMVIDRLR
jgi:hypothetical protein